MKLRGMTAAVMMAGALAVSGCGSQPSQASVGSGHAATTGFIGAVTNATKGALGKAAAAMSVASDLGGTHRASTAEATRARRH